MTPNEELKRIIAEIKFKKGLKQAEVADILGVKSTYLSDMINGRVPYSDAMQSKLYEQFSDCINSANQPISGQSNAPTDDQEKKFVDSSIISRAFDEIASHRSIIERTIAMLEKKDEQIDRLISIIEKN